MTLRGQWAGALVLLCAIATPQAQQTVGISNLTADGISSGEAYSLTTAFRTELGKTGKFDLMERSQMEEILKEQGFQKSGACDETTCAIEMGRILAVKYMVLGHVGKVGRTYTLNVRLVDVGTGKIAGDVTEYHKGSIDDLLTTTVVLVAKKLAGTYEEEEKTRKGLIIGLGSAVVAAAIAVPIIIMATADEETDNTTSDVHIKWNQ